MSEQQARAEITQLAHQAVLDRERPVIQLALYKALTPPLLVVALALIGTWIHRGFQRPAATG